MRKFHTNLIPAIVLGLGLAGPAAAQPAPQNPPPPPAAMPYGMMMQPMMGGGMMGMPMPMPIPMMGGGMMPMPMMGGGMMGMMMAHPDGYLAFLKTEIGITEAQTALWTAYTDQLQPLIKRHHEAMQKIWAPDAKPPTWIERLTEMQTRMSAHQEAMKKVIPAATALYAALTPEQKAKADALMPGGMGMNMGFMGRGMHGPK